MDKREIGEIQANQALYWIDRFGWLTNKQLGALIFSEAAESDALARRLTTKLEVAGLIMHRPNTSGVHIYVLTAKGAERLHEAGESRAKGGKYQKITTIEHRACANWRLIKAIKDGFEVYTEFEILSGRAPLVAVDKKAPDGLIRTDEGLLWVEVENAWKNRARRAEIVKFAGYNIRTPEMHRLTGNEFLYGLEIVAANRSALKSAWDAFQEAQDAGLFSDEQAYYVNFELFEMNRSLGLTGVHTRSNLLYDDSECL